MTKKSTRGEFKSFVKGLITEASPLNFPEQAVRDIDNFELNKDGSLNRRLGFEFEEGFSLFDLGITISDAEDGKLSSFVWEDPAGQVNVKYLVIQAAGTLFFFNLNSDVISVSGYLGSLAFPSANQKLSTSSFVAINGKLVISSGSADVYLIEYLTDTASFSLSSFRLKTRDIWGVSSGESDENPKFQPASITAPYLYNMYNQGWGVPRLSALVGGATLVDPINALGIPTEADSVWSSIITFPLNGEGVEILSFSAFLATKNATSYPPKGYFIIDLLNRGASRSQEVAKNSATHPVLSFTSFTSNADYTDKGASVVCEYAGRIFYAGFGATQEGDVRSPDLSGYIAFTSLVRNSNDFSKCYQEGDPSSREASDVIDTDGGLIRISGASGILKIIPLAESLLVFATNGVWVVSGGSDYGFTATNYKVSQISSFGIISADSAVSDGVRVVYWSEDSIYSIQKDQYGVFGYTSISEASIETFYENIDVVAKANSKGIYDKVSKKIKWIYHPFGLFGANTKELVLDTLLGSYSLNTYKNLPTTAIYSIFTGAPFINTINESVVYSAGDTVLSNVDSVVVNEEVLGSQLQATKYVALINDTTLCLAIGWNKETTFVDWRDVDSVGIDAKAFFLTGAITAGDSSIHKQTPLLVIHMERTEKSIDASFELENKSSCKVRTMWDWATSVNSNKFSPLFEAYRYRRHYMPEEAPGAYDNGFELVTTRNKLRGRGRALSLYMETTPLKDCKIIGWNLSLNGNAVA